MMKKILSYILCLFLLLPAGGMTGAEEESMELSLYAINVRKADALLLRSGKTAYLIDTGTEDSYPALRNVLQAEGITSLDSVILTHTHKDHTGGLEYLLDSGIEIKQVYASGYYNKKNESKHPAVKALNNIKSDMKVTFLLAGMTLPLDGGTLEVLGPQVKDEEAENNNSLVLLATGGGGTMLLTGDMEFPEEQNLLKSGLIPHVDIIKIGNHGEGDATSEALIAAASPTVAVISTNTEDEPDTPDPRVIQLLGKYGITVYQTQETENGVLITLKNGEIAAESK